MLIDSNILIYAINTRSPKNKSAVKFLKTNLNHLEISHQNILETIRVMTHKKFSNPMKAEAVLEAISPLLETARVITPNQLTLELFSHFIKEYNKSGNRIFDAYLAATALSNDVSEIATDNIKDFEKFKGLKIVNPF